jgi:hypothetical protein
MEVMLELLTNGFTITTLPIKPAHHIKLLDTITELDAQRKLNAETVSQVKDVGLRKEPKFTELTNLEMSQDKKI